jgi:hypothetical protein
MVCLCDNLGKHMPFFVPEQAGKNYRPSRYLKVIDDLREHYTIFSGVSHPEVDGAHAAEKSFLTCAPHPGSGSFKNSISLDQYAAEFVGKATRIPSLALAANGNSSLSWTRAGVPIPGATRPSEIFKKLFLTGSRDEIESQVTRLRMGESIMDTVLAQAKAVEKKLTTEDRQKFEEYTTSVREVEQQLIVQQEWEKKPKPEVKVKPPKDIREQEDVIGRAKLMYDLIYLAIQTDSTRLITCMTEGFFVVPPIDGVEEGYHTLSHHGQNNKKLEQLAIIEEAQMSIFGDFLRRLKSTNEQDSNLLDRTMVFYGSDLGNASSHDNRNLPALIAGGGFKHGQHLAFDTANNYPLANLFVSMLQRLGIEADRFGSSTGTMRGLEFS